jgi:predicted ATPase/DNA-binding XRE family transcriptional regulator/Flp pilus assembly protein TadD
MSINNKSPEEISFGEWLHQRRRMLDLTQQALSDQVGCARITLRRIESGARKPSKELAHILLNKLGVPEIEHPQWVLFARGVSGFPAKPGNSFTNKLLTNLPTSLTSFIGRNKELDEITKLIAKNRLLTLTGAGGIGKTRLSMQVASGLLNDFPNGIWLIELAPLSDPALVTQAVVATLGLIEQAGRSPLMILTDFLQARWALLVLDNCEHLIQACAQLAETLLRACPNLHILATSRESLGVAGEALYHVPSLVLPDVQNLLEKFREYESVRLFEERAQLVQMNFALTLENASHVAQICRSLDGIPLAIELAAARVNMFSTEQIAARLNENFNLITGGARTALPRHQTLRALIDWSHDLLSEPERVLLRRLSVFAGGWTLEAAESVCAGEGIEKHEILELLTQVVNKSLILAERKQGQETRYHMLETIRQYARDKLWAAGEGERLPQHHLAYFVELAEQAEPNLRAFDMVMWLDRLEAEHDNIRAALLWALESDIEAELRLASALWWFWHIRDHKSEGTEWLERALSIETMERGDQPLTPGRAMIRGKALYVAGFLRIMMWETDIGAALSKESLTLFQELGPAGKQGMAYALWNLSVRAAEELNLHQRKALMEESLALFQEVGDKFGIAQCLPSIGDIALVVDGDYERGRALTEEGLAQYEEIGDKDGIANTLGSLGYLAFHHGDYQQATKRFESSLVLFQEVRNKYGLIGTLYGLAQAAIAQGRYEKAITVLEEALILERESGSKFAMAYSRYSLGEVAAAQGNYKQAAERYEEGLALGQQTENPRAIAFGFCGLGKVAWAQGDYEKATQKFEAALAVSQNTGDKFERALALYGLGRVAQSQGHYISARALHTEGIILYQERVVPNGEIKGAAYHLEALAILATAHAQKQMEEAARLFGAAETLYAPVRFEMSDSERAEHDQAVAAARAALGEKAFQAAWEEGKKMNLEEAVAYALNESQQ